MVCVPTCESTHAGVYAYVRLCSEVSGVACMHVVAYDFVREWRLYA
jgi:hypothetical protein